MKVTPHSKLNAAVARVAQQKQIPSVYMTEAEVNARRKECQEKLEAMLRENHLNPEEAAAEEKRKRANWKIRQ